MSNTIVWTPSRNLIESSNLHRFLEEHGLESYEALAERADADPQWFWNAVLAGLRFDTPYTRVFDDSDGAPFTRWCIGGRTNAVANCLDRHEGTPVWDKELLLWESETGALERFTYAEMNASVSRLAGGLRSLDVKRGEVVAIYLPNIPEAFVAFYAIVKIGAIALPMFSGFGSAALADRLRHAGAVAVITADVNRRRGELVPMKVNVDAIADDIPDLRHIITVHRNTPLADDRGRNVAYERLVSGMPDRSATEIVDADDPMMIMYTSGTTGRPKGTVHTHCGFPAKMILDVGLMLDLRASDRLMWISDMGWLVGPIAAVATSLQCATYLMVEGGPDFPDRDRIWRLVEKHAVSYLGVAPTMIRSLMKAGDQDVQARDMSSIRVCASTGEVWNPEAWHWTFDHVCGRQAPILNWSGGTEIGGGVLAGTVLHSMKPCAFTTAIPGMQADVVDDHGHPVAPGEVGELVMRGASIGLTRGLWRDEDRYVDSYWSMFPGLWRQGDWATVDGDRFWYLLGRSDDTLKIAGKRIGPSEIENCLTSTGLVSEAAVVGLPDPVKGQAIWCVVIPRPDVERDEATTDRLSAAIVAGMGATHRPRAVLMVSDLPKTRNMKIMRRVVRAACMGSDPGDLSSLVNPETVEVIVEAAQRHVAAPDAGRERQ